MLSLVITNACLNYLLALTRSLQAEAKDIIQAVSEISHVKAALCDVRDNIEVHHSEWFSTVEQLCANVGIQPSLPRVCGRQRHRSNVPAETPSEYYRRNLSIPVLDHLLSELDTRFTTHQQTALQGLNLIPSVLVTKSVEEISPKICQLGQMYECDLPHGSSLPSELHCWHMKWKQQEEEHGQASLPTSPSLSLPHASAMFPNIKVLLLTLCTLLFRRTIF